MSGNTCDKACAHGAKTRSLILDAIRWRSLRNVGFWPSMTARGRQLWSIETTADRFEVSWS